MLGAREDVTKLAKMITIAVSATRPSAMGAPMPWGPTLCAGTRGIRSESTAKSTANL